MLVCFGNQAEGSLEMIGLQLILFQQGRSAGVGADTVHTMVEAQYGAAALCQLIVMSLGFQFFLGVDRSVEAENLAT